MDTPNDNIELSDRTVIETPDGWMIRCQCLSGEEGTWHEFPKQGKPGATWTFNGDLVRPTFTPSMNTCLNPSNSPHFNEHAHLRDFRCHFIVTNGMIAYCGDCTNESLRGKTMPLLRWPKAKVAYYEHLMSKHRANGGQ